MNTAELDFYVPGPDQKKLREEKLAHQRKDMTAWRGGNAQQSESQGLSLGPKQIVPKDSELARSKAEEERRKREPVWGSAAVHQPDRRREWRNNGFEFDRDHFRNSGNPNSYYHSTQKAQHGECSGERYVPYVHDNITMVREGDGTSSGNSKENLTVVTYNKDEMRQQELAASAKARSGITERGAEQEEVPNSGLCDVLGPDVAGKQRAVDLAGQMRSELVAQECERTGSPYGPQASRNYHAPTSEVGYVIRPGYEDRHDRKQATYREGTNLTNSTVGGRSVHSTTATRDGSEAEPHTLPSEVKSLRVYNVELNKKVTNKDTGMIRRKSPPRQGEPVILPDSWRNNTN